MIPVCNRADNCVAIVRHAWMKQLAIRLRYQKTIACRWLLPHSNVLSASRLFSPPCSGLNCFLESKLICSLIKIEVATFIKFATMLLYLFPIAVSAQNLPDPTRPAIALVQTEGKAGGSAANPDAAPIADAPNKGLQSIIISPNRRAAMINGQVLELGEKSGGVTLLEVNEREVVLQSANGKKVMQLFPSVEMTGVEMTNFQANGLPKISKPSALQQNEPAAKEEK